MKWLGWILLASSVPAIFVGIRLATWLRRSTRESRFAKARRDFHTQREYLEAKFFDLASRSGKPRGLDWADCSFEDDVAYARDRRSGELSALVGMTIGFTATEGGGMEDVEAVSNLRAATAVFVFLRGRWSTQGRAIFNLNPTETISFYQDNLEMVAQETAHPV